jgi:biotin-(acetyl-CoA carboxylase) ligase
MFRRGRDLQSPHGGAAWASCLFREQWVFKEIFAAAPKPVPGNCIG